MAKVLVFNEDSNRMETYNLAENQPMPYNTGDTLRVSEFRGSSRSPTLWTSKRTMEAFNRLRSLWGNPIPVGFAFKRPWEGGHSAQSQHYNGSAFDAGQRLTNERRNALRRVATESGLWSYVEPAWLTPTWVHFDRRQSPAACGGTAGYPTVREGSRGTYVLLLQDSLNTLGYPTGGLDGMFGPATANAVRNVQRQLGLTADGIVGCSTWRAIANAVVGKGRTGTTID